MTNTPVKLGQLQPVDLRTVWDDEAGSFTPWLSKEANLKVLSDAIGVEFEAEDTEVLIGSYKADIVCKTSDDETAIIENQLEKTNHDHLGKIITYASGLNAKYVIWICRKATEEHRRAIDWLNEISGEAVYFFLLELELWRIGESEPAPKFNVVCSPNEWAKEVRGGGISEGVWSETKMGHLEFWNRLKDYMEENKTFLRLRRPRPQHWYSMAVGRSKFQISLTRNTSHRKLGCEIYIRGRNAKMAFALLQEQKQEIESKTGELEWKELPGKQDCRIVQYMDADVNDKDDWPRQFEWLRERAGLFHNVFSERIRKLNLSE